ncbi:hypothetical protein KKE26_09835 [bacterium]|nr:hypothetical protein [bacterium]MBU1753001.1 hypothetical protein [bacterium]
MTVEEKVRQTASKIGDPWTVLSNALKKDILVKLSELNQVVQRLEEKYGVNFEDFDKQNLLDQLGHTWDVEEDYYEWDRVVTELHKLEEILRGVE